MKFFVLILVIILSACATDKDKEKKAKQVKLPLPEPIIQTQITELSLGEASTALLDNGANRINNINIACLKISGYMLAPGAEFSFNTVVGLRTAHAGFLIAPVIIDGKKEYGIGGGICQVSTTLYMAACNAGLSVTEHHPHSESVPYAQEGCDATVVYGLKDLRFVNNTENEVYIYTWMADGKIFSKIIKKTVDNITF